LLRNRAAAYVARAERGSLSQQVDKRGQLEGVDQSDQERERNARAALIDVDEAIQLDDSSCKGRYRRAKALVLLGRLDEARREVEVCKLRASSRDEERAILSLEKRVLKDLGELSEDGHVDEMEQLD